MCRLMPATYGCESELAETKHAVPSAFTPPWVAITSVTPVGVASVA